MEPETLMNFLSNFENIQNLNKLKNDEQSKIDIELSDCYHKIEGTTITHVSQSHKLIKQLKDILSRRRQIKYETILLRTTCDNLDIIMKSLKQKINDHNKKHREILNKLKENSLLENEK
jgi:predicted transcriptional regulator